MVRKESHQRGGGATCRGRSGGDSRATAGRFSDGPAMGARPCWLANALRLPVVAFIYCGAAYWSVYFTLLGLISRLFRGSS